MNNNLLKLNKKVYEKLNGGVAAKTIEPFLFTSPTTANLVCSGSNPILMQLTEA